MKFPTFRPVCAAAAGVMLPLGVVWAGVTKLRDAHPLLQRSGLVLGGLTLLCSELPALRVLYGVDALGVDPLVLRVGLAALGLSSLILEALAARRSLRVRVSAWLWIALGFGAYLAGAARPEPGDTFGVVFVAAVVGLWGGGLLGLSLGALGARLVPRVGGDKPTAL
jgi:hypothetical protein